jgi:Ca2+-binding EF-hand superfamily protein
VFRRINEDDNKQLNQTELIERLKEYGLDLSDDEIINMFNILDADSSGGINIEEFITAVRVSYYEINMSKMLNILIEKISRF